MDIDYCVDAVKAFESSCSAQAFVNCDLGLSQSDQVFAQMNVTNQVEEYNNFGDLENLRSELFPFIVDLGNDESHSLSIAEKIANIIHELIPVNKTAYIIIRATTPNHNFDIPRFHTDGAFYEPYDSPQYKIAMTLKGASTLFVEPSQNQREELDIIQKNFSASEMLDYQIKSQQIFFNSSILTASFGQASLFRVGIPHEEAAVHSEPKMETERLFLSIVIGSKEQVEKRKEFLRLK